MRLTMPEMYQCQYCGYHQLETRGSWHAEPGFMCNPCLEQWIAENPDLEGVSW